MNFDLIAKDLLKPKTPVNPETPLERANTLVELANAGFSPREVFSELRQLYDSTDDDSIKKQLLDMVVKVHGLYKDDDTKIIPKIVFNIVGKSDRVTSMLCPMPQDERVA